MATPTKAAAPTIVPTGFDQVLHLRYRLYLPAVLGLPLLAVYDALRSFVWRQEDYGPEALTRLSSKGFLAAAPTQTQIGGVTHLARETVNRSLRKLERMGWIIVDESSRPGTPKVYRLGLKAGDTFGGSEAPYADAVMGGWYSALDAKARAQHKTAYRHLPSHLQVQLVTAHLTSLKGGVIGRSHPAPTAAAHTLHFAPEQALAGGCDPVAGGCDRGSTPPPVTPKKPENWVEENQGVTTPSEGGGGVILDHRGCDRMSHQYPEVRVNKPAESLDFPPKQPVYIDSIHRHSLTTFGRTLRTSYSESSLHSASVVQATAGDPRSLRSHGPPSGLAAHRQETPHGASNPPAQTLTPVPPAPFPFGVEGVTPAKVRVTSSAGTQKEAAPVPVYRFNPSRTAQDPSEGEISSPRAVSGDSREAVSSLKSVVEDAQARSREALAQKNERRMERQRAKERKVDNLASTQSYRQQKSAAMRLEQVWREEMSTAFPDIPQATWFKRGPKGVMARKEGKLASDLIDAYGAEEVVTDLVQTFVRHFASDFSQMLTKQPDSVPTFGLFYACHASVAAEAPKVRRRHDAIGQYEAWKAANAHNDFAVPPPELEAAYKVALAKKGKK
jgi:hypothetical protein